MEYPKLVDSSHISLKRDTIISNRHIVQYQNPFIPSNVLQHLSSDLFLKSLNLDKIGTQPYFLIQVENICLTIYEEMDFYDFSVRFASLCSA